MFQLFDRPGIWPWGRGMGSGKGLKNLVGGDAPHMVLRCSVDKGAVPLSQGQGTAPPFILPPVQVATVDISPLVSGNLVNFLGVTSDPLLRPKEDEALGMGGQLRAYRLGLGLTLAVRSSLGGQPCAQLWPC